MPSPSPRGRRPPTAPPHAPCSRPAAAAPAQAAMAARLTALVSKARAAAEPAIKVASKEVASRYEQLMASNAQVGAGQVAGGRRRMAAAHPADSCCGFGPALCKPKQAFPAGQPADQLDE